VFYKVNSRFRCFTSGTGQITGLSAYYIAQDPTMLRVAWPTRESTISLKQRHTWTYDYQRLYLHHGPWHDHLFHDRRTYARSRSRCSRPERGQPKVPFSWCRWHILVIDYRWGSMGSDETASTIPGGPRVIDVFNGNGAPSGPNYLLFSDVDRLSDALRDRSGVG
jgi:hypothetical protein